MVERGDLAVDQDIRQRASLFGDDWKLIRPIQPFTGFKRGLAVLDAQLHAITVEFDLVAPPFPAGWALDRDAELGCDEIRNRRDLLGFCQFRGHGPRYGLALRARFRRIAAVRMPDRIRLAATGLCRHERLWRFALAFGDLVHGPSRGHRLIGIQDIVGRALFREFVAMFYQQPIRSFAPVTVMAHADQHPTAVELVAVQREFQVALLESFFGVVGLPIAAVPELHCAAAILALRNGAFKIAVIERMIFHLNREALVVRIERGTAGDRPGLEDAVELEPQIVVQPGRIMCLNDEPPAF